VAFEEVAREFPPDSHAMFVALSYAKMNSIRAAKYAAAKELGYRLASHVSPRASAWEGLPLDRKSTRLNSSHEWSSYDVFCLKKKGKFRALLNHTPKRKHGRDPEKERKRVDRHEKGAKVEHRGRV